MLGGMDSSSSMPPSSTFSLHNTSSTVTEESFAKSLFAGAPAEDLILPYPGPSRSDIDALLPLFDGIKKLGGKHVDSARIDADARISPEVFAELRNLGVFGLVVPRDYGGLGLGMTAYGRVIQELANVDASLALTVSAHQSLGLGGVLAFGSEALKASVLPRCRTGETLSAFALVEAGAGSDAGGIQTRADRFGSGYVIRGEKNWVTNGELADIFTVFARTSPADEGAKPRITAFVVERGPGVTSGPRELTHGVRGTSTTSLSLSDVHVPESHVLGDVGRGFRVAMHVLTSARLALAASCIGSSKKLLKLAIDRATQRKTFGRSISEFGLIKDKLAMMQAELFAMESMTYLTTGLVDAGRRDFSIESAMCKVFASETLWRLANESASIAGALSYTRREPWERLLRDARAPLVFEGTNEILRCFIALSGMQEPSREIEGVAKAMLEPIKGFGLLGDYALRKAKNVWSSGRLNRSHPSLAHESVLIVRYAQELSRSVDKVLRRHGKNIAEMQYTQRRVADIALDLYALSSSLSRTSRAIERRGEEGARREIDLLTVFSRSAASRIEKNLAGFDNNDDELRKDIANKACSDGSYPLDIF
jgi:acyl-CoA dehydrogenase family protein 9